MTQTIAVQGTRRFGFKSARRLSALVLLVGGLGLWSCGDDGHPPTQSILPPPSDGTGGQVSLGGMGGVSGSGNADGTGGLSEPGTGGSAPMTVCGDLFLESGEECEEGRFRDETCVSRGFSAGQLRCDSSCEIQTDDCSGIEDCFDGQDNDGDGLVDCLDPVDCSSVCGDACEGPTASFGGLSINGTTAGRGNVFDGSCSDSEGSGAEVVYEVTAGEDGKLDVNLITSAPLNLSVTTSCGDPETELVCASARRFSIDAFEGEVFFVTVEGNEAADVGAYFLEVRSRVPGCADGVLDPGEECDDFNTVDGDGCDEDCYLESDESEPNGEFASANEVSDERFVAAISPANDVDLYSVTTTEASSTIVVGTSHLGDGACSYNLMDTQIEVLGTDDEGHALIVMDDNSGDGLCSLSVAPGLSPGTYYIRVRAAPGASPAVFPYVLEVEVGVCGDDEQSLGEECDDGNITNGDGCSSDCEVEF